MINDVVKILVNNDILDNKAIKDNNVANLFNDLQGKGLISEIELNNIDKYIKKQA